MCSFGGGGRSSKDFIGRIQIHKLVPELAVCSVLQKLLKRSKREIFAHFSSSKFFDAELSVNNYAARFHQLSMMERITRQLELEMYDWNQVQVCLMGDDFLYKHCAYVPMQNVKEIVSQVTTYNKFEFTHTETKTKVVVGDIVELLDHAIVVRLQPEDASRFDTNRYYNVKFLVNVYSFNVECDALRFVCAEGVVRRLFPSTVKTRPCADSTQIQWFNADIAHNPHQQQAVRHIVAGTAYPAPYILFGPPGTGKTQTLVEAIAQIHTRDAHSRILVCATTNEAADELALRLIRTPIGHQVYRLYTKTYRPVTPIENELRHCSNFDLQFCPDFVYLDKYHILVATLFTGGRLRYAGPPKDYFTHLFLDDCGRASELATLMPIACADSAQIVLSGDSKQLGPIVRCEAAAQFGLGLSLLERLMANPVYQRRSRTGLANPNVLTELANNYRSHPAILVPSNRLFYYNEILACSPSVKTNCFLGWRHLPAPNIPIIFHECIEPSETDGTSEKIFNTHEVNMVWNYVSVVMKETINGRPVGETDIGIIAPYKKQCHKISEMLRHHNLHRIMVDTVEKFQGQERPIIIISTTRSQTSGIGFLRNPKRLNVMLTRAQCLLVIVGNPYTLQQDYNWSQVLHGFRAAGVCIEASLLDLAPRNIAAAEQAHDWPEATTTVATILGNSLAQPPDTRHEIRNWPRRLHGINNAARWRTFPYSR